jgi:NTE family protein
MDALVLGGGGPVGATWTSALLRGLISAGLPAAESDVVLGTSAGAVLGAWLTTRPEGLSLIPELMRRRAAWHAANAKAGAGDRSVLRRAAGSSGRDAEAARVLGQAAIAAMAPISLDEAETLWKANLPEGPWSPRLRTVSVDAETGLVRVWSAEDGISVPVGIACSTAGPGVAPPVAVAGSVWVDGGVRSSTNADLLIELGTPGKALVIAPSRSGALTHEEAALVERGHRVRTIVAEPFYQKPTDMLDPGFIDIAADTGASQARDIAADLLTWWRD